MAKLNSNKAVGDLQGTVGGLVYVHRADGSVIVRRAVETHGEFSAKQLGCQSRFAEAQEWAKALSADPERYAPYKVAARITRKRACNIVVSDFLKPPGRPGDRSVQLHWQSWRTNSHRSG